MNKYTHIETQRDNTITSNCEYNQHSFVLPAVLPLYLLLRTLCDLLFVCVHADTQLAKPKPSHHYCPKPLTQSLALQCHQSTCKWTTTGTAAAAGNVSVPATSTSTNPTRRTRARFLRCKCVCVCMYPSCPLLQFASWLRRFVHQSSFAHGSLCCLWKGQSYKRRESVCRHGTEFATGARETKHTVLPTA